MEPRQTRNRQPQIDLLTNLQDDLSVLENTWQRKKISSPKAAKHLREIVQSVHTIAKAESFGEFETICIETLKRLNSVENKKTDLEKRQWALVSELIEHVKTSLRDATATAADVESRMGTWNAKSSTSGPADGSNGSSSDDLEESSPREEPQMSTSIHANAQELLQKAQEALVSGNGENAKELAMQAAEILAKLEAEEAKKKEKQLRSDLELAVHEEAEAEETLARIKEEMADSENEINQLTNRLSEADSSFKEQQKACQQFKEKIENIEAEITRLNEEHKTLVEQFQEALPARDAAERECVRLKKELEKLAPEMELITDSTSSAEQQLSQARERREILAAELDKVMAKIGA